MKIKSHVVLVLLLSAIFVMLSAKPSNASDATKSLLWRYSYNLQIVTGGLQWYWEEYGQMPESLADMYNAGGIPINLVNPFNGLPLPLKPNNLNPGDIQIGRLDPQTVLVTAIEKDGYIFQENWDSAIYQNPPPSPGGVFPRKNLNHVDNMISQYLFWVHVSLQHYYADKGKVPNGIDDLMGAGYWPFNDIMNPITGTPMQFFGRNPGDLNFEFGPTVYCRAIFSDGSTGCDSISPETGGYWPRN